MERHLEAKRQLKVLFGGVQKTPVLGLQDPKAGLKDPKAGAQKTLRLDSKDFDNAWLTDVV